MMQKENLAHSMVQKSQIMAQKAQTMAQKAQTMPILFISLQALIDMSLDIFSDPQTVSLVTTMCWMGGAHWLDAL